MSSYEKRLNDLQRVYQSTGRLSGSPFDPSLLTAEELAELDELNAVLASMDVGPGPLAPERDFAARLEGLSDEQLYRSRVLLMKGLGRDTTGAERVWQMSGAADGGRV
ncbi:MAG: hypothetical protein M3R02_09775 [Chloroflexota bacterium]|nr:hypothetical protein [Chloroflexota bacterium]